MLRVANEIIEVKLVIARGKNKKYSAVVARKVVFSEKVCLCITKIGAILVFCHNIKPEKYYCGRIQCVNRLCCL